MKKVKEVKEPTELELANQKIEKLTKENQTLVQQLNVHKQTIEAFKIVIIRRAFDDANVVIKPPS